MDRYTDELPSRWREAEKLQIFHLKKELYDWANESEENRLELEKYRARIKCHIKGCSNTSIALESFNGVRLCDRTERLGMGQCLKCDRWTCAEHFLYFQRPPEFTGGQTDVYVRVCVDCLPFNSNQIKWTVR